MFRISADGIIIDVHAQPNASKNQIVGEHGGRLKIKLQSPPIEGKANDCLIELLSDILGLAKSKIKVIKGETSREKSVLLIGETQISSINDKLLKKI